MGDKMIVSIDNEFVNTRHVVRAVFTPGSIEVMVEDAFEARLSGGEHILIKGDAAVAAYNLFKQISISNIEEVEFFRTVWNAEDE